MDAQLAGNSVVHRPHWRTHIDGLRAISVMAVLLYHTDSGLLSGGFVGVDVFFVISGFLISRVIYADIESSGLFHFGYFYERRARRIIPVLVVVTLAVLTVGWLFYLPDAFSQLAQSAIYSVGFAANIFFYLHSDYFSPAASTQPLLHYWSLGVEEQFYIVFPLLVWGLMKWAPRYTTAVVAALALISLAASEYSLGNYTSAAFYLAPLRAWELLAGSLVAIRSFPFPNRPLIREILAAIGLLLIGYAVFQYDDGLRFPGIHAAVPVVGAATILLACEPGETRVGRLLSLRPLRWVGLWSYSIYMVHWPLIVFGRMIYPDTTSKIFTPAVFILSIGLGLLSYEIVERPFRGGKPLLGRKGVLFGAAAALAVIALACQVTIVEGGFAYRLSPDAKRLLAFNNYDPRAVFRMGQCFMQPEQGWNEIDKRFCLPTQHPLVLLWGDSHLADLNDAIREVVKPKYASVAMVTASNCPPMLGIDVGAPRPNCKPINDALAQWVKNNKPEQIVLSALWPLDRWDHLDQTVALAKSVGAHVTIIGQAPFYSENVPSLLARRRQSGDQGSLSRTDLTEMAKQGDDLIEHRYDGDPAVTYISLWQGFCGGLHCPMLTPDGTPVEFDQNHFTSQGAAFAISKIAPQLDAALGLQRSRGALAY
jgi:peptidoglycan/LPS O-acetylase OafA/YrhL